MKLHLYPIEGYEEVIKEYYHSHGTFRKGNAGLDLFCVENVVVPARATSVKVPLGVRIEAFYPHTMRYQNNRGYTKSEQHLVPAPFYLVPRSSTGSKTPIRLSNGVGVIHTSFQNALTAIVDNVSDEPFTMKKGERYFQVCAPALVPIEFELVDTLSDARDGSTGE